MIYVAIIKLCKNRFKNYLYPICIFSYVIVKMTFSIILRPYFNEAQMKYYPTLNYLTHGVIR